MSMSDLMRMEFKQAFEEFDKVIVPLYVIQCKRSRKKFKKGGRKVLNHPSTECIVDKFPSVNSLLQRKVGISSTNAVPYTR